MVKCAEWPVPILYREITNCELSDDGVLWIHYEFAGKHKQTIKMSRFAKNQQEVLDAINRYYTRYLAAVEYQEQKKLEADSHDA